MCEDQVTTLADQVLHLEYWNLGFVKAKVVHLRSYKITQYVKALTMQIRRPEVKSLEPKERWEEIADPGNCPLTSPHAWNALPTCIYHVHTNNKNLKLKWPISKPLRENVILHTKRYWDHADACVSPIKNIDNTPNIH